jgi:hypothetical protein
MGLSARGESGKFCMKVVFWGIGGVTRVVKGTNWCVYKLSRMQSHQHVVQTRSHSALGKK